MMEVKGHPNLVRCPDSNAILNTDREHIERVRQAKIKRQQEKAEKAMLESRITNLENQLTDINTALQILINRD